MFIQTYRRQRPRHLWAAPLLVLAMLLGFGWLWSLPAEHHRLQLQHWGALAIRDASGLSYWHALLSHPGDTLPQLFTALFLHEDAAHVIGNATFLLIFGLPTERGMGGWRFLLLVLLGGAFANAATLLFGAPNQLVIGASGAVSTVVGAYVALFPRSHLGVVLPLGVFLQFVRVPTLILIGLWFMVQMLFAWHDPSYGAVAWIAHASGLAFGLVFALLMRRHLRQPRYR